MKLKKLVSGLLMGAMVATSIQVPAAVSGAEVELNEATVPSEGLVASYTFDDTLADAKNPESLPTMFGQSFAAYDGAPKYAEGKNNKALDLDGYGIQLNRPNVGENYTVSLWMKADTALDNNQILVALGHHNPENWFALSGKSGGSAKLWSNVTEGDYSGKFSWTEVAGTSFPVSEWQHITITGTSGHFAFYKNGELVQEGDGPAPLAGEDQDICIGVNNWDTTFDGQIDDLMVYNRSLSALEVAKLYDPTITPESAFEKTGVTAETDVTLEKGQTANVNATISALAQTGNPSFVYESADPSVATVDATGLVTGVSKGETTITTKVTVGATTKEAVTAVKVIDTVTSITSGELVGAFTFDNTLENAVEGKEAATPLIAGLSAYDGQIRYQKGKVGGAAILEDHGFELNTKNVGKNYAVSLWMKLTGSMAENQAGVFLGYHNPEKWMGLAGLKAEQFKFWADGTTDAGAAIKWATYSQPTISANEWHHIVMTGKDGESYVYMDGVLAGTAKKTLNPLDGENQDIYVGTNNWDPAFPGLVDEVKIYNGTLTSQEVQLLYEEGNSAVDTPEDVIRYTGITAKENIDLLVTKDATVDAVIPEGVDASAVKLTYRSEDESVATVDATGKVTAVKGGKTTIITTATLGDATAEAKTAVKVIDIADLLAIGAAVDTTYATETGKKNLEDALLEANKVETFEEAAIAEKALEQAIFGMTYDENYVDPFAAIKEPAASLKTTVKSKKTLLTIPAEIKDFVDVQYLTSNNKVVTYANGVATAVGAGKATVTAIVTSKYEDGFVMEYSTAVSVATPEIAVKTVSVSAKSATLGAKESLTISAKVSPSNATNKKITYKSSNTKVAKVSSSGKITAVKAGKATITATASNGKKATVRITVKNAPKKVSFKSNKVTVKVKKTTTLKVVLPSNTASNKLTFTSSNKKVATVSDKGVVKGIKKGTATITVKTYNGKKATCKVTVK